MMFIEALDYGVTIDSKETINFFRNFPDRGSIGYFSFEDAEADRNPLGNIEKYLNIVEDFISAGLIGDHYVFSNGQVSEIISEYEGWDWTPETGIVPWESEIDPEPEVCLNRKQRRSARRVQNARHKKSDRLHGKCHGDKYLESLPRKKYLEADNYDHPTFRVEKGKLHPIHDVRRERETAKFHDALDISPVERLTASVLAHMSNHVFMWDEQLVYDLTEAICEEYKQPYPDDSYITKDGVGIVHLTFQVERFEPGYGSYVEETDYRLN